MSRLIFSIFIILFISCHPKKEHNKYYPNGALRSKYYLIDEKIEGEMLDYSQNGKLVSKKMFSKSCEYAVRATIFIATHCGSDGKVGLKEIANEIDSPVAFTAKILQVLVKNNIVKSSKGVGGGFMVLKDDLKRIKLSDIVMAIDGDSVFLRCGLGLSNCSEEHPCPVHEKFKFVKRDLIFMLETTSLEELTLGFKKGETFLKY